MTSLFQGVRGGYGGRICGGSQDDSAWASGRVATYIENLGHRGRTADVSHGFTGQGRPADIHGGGMPRPSGNEDGDAGPFTTPECPGHHVHSGGGKHPSPTVPPMRHAGPLSGNEQKAHYHSSLHQGRREKDAAASEDESEGDLGEGL